MLRSPRDTHRNTMLNNLALVLKPEEAINFQETLEALPSLHPDRCNSHCSEALGKVIRSGVREVLVRYQESWLVVGSPAVF